jgi:tetratricopeptide (TPR) repeat protein
MKKNDQQDEKDGQDTGTSPAAYIKTARNYLRSGEHKAAYRILLEAVLHYPEQPLILSYYGCLQAIVDRRYRSGIEACRKALALFKAADIYTAGIVFPILYLNLGRAYIAAGKKKDAIEALSKGQRYDKAHSEIKKELQLLGIRKKPAVPFLSRANPINKYIGMLLHNGRKQTKQRPEN